MSAARCTASDRWHDRVESGGWASITAEVNEYSGAPPRLLAPEEISGRYQQNNLCRNTAGEYLLTQQRPRAQTRGTTTLLPYAHGVSAIRPGEQHSLALVFHDVA
jgi:hypothetical protein